MLTNINPAIVFIEDNFINMDNVDSYSTNEDYLFIKIEYSNSDSTVIRFGSIHELRKAVAKLNRAQLSLDYGTVYE